MASHQGFVNELVYDYGSGLCHVTLSGYAGMADLATKYPQVQSLLEVAFATRKYATVEYEEAGSPYIITKATINIEYPPDR